MAAGGFSPATTRAAGEDASPFDLVADAGLLGVDSLAPFFQKRSGAWTRRPAGNVGPDLGIDPVDHGSFPEGMENDGWNGRRRLDVHGPSATGRASTLLTTPLSRPLDSRASLRRPTRRGAGRCVGHSGASDEVGEWDSRVQPPEGTPHALQGGPGTVRNEAELACEGKGRPVHVGGDHDSIESGHSPAQLVQGNLRGDAEVFLDLPEDVLLFIHVDLVSQPGRIVGDSRQEIERRRKIPGGIRGSRRGTAHGLPSPSLPCRRGESVLPPAAAAKGGSSGWNCSRVCASGPLPFTGTGSKSAGGHLQDRTAKGKHWCAVARYGNGT
jgi:hypothetical protein